MLRRIDIMVLTPQRRIVDIRNIDMFDNNKIAVICNAYIFHLPPSLQGQTNKKVDKHRFIHQRSDLYFGVHGSKYGVFPHHFLRTRIVFFTI